MATEEASLQAAREEAARLISALSASGGNGAVELLKQIEGMSKRRRAEIDEEVRYCWLAANSLYLRTRPSLVSCSSQTSS
jgi:hypothetical protein